MGPASEPREPKASRGGKRAARRTDLFPRPPLEKPTADPHQQVRTPLTPKRRTSEMGIRLELTGQRFGRLSVLRLVPGPGKSRWECRCDCGKDTIIAGSQLRARTKSCGCLHKEIASRNLRKHGYAGTPTYNIWKGIKKRCYAKSFKDYHDYGGRGIRVCVEWLDSFEAFLRDMGERPAGMSIERKDSAGDYEPGNCIWADAKTQSRNRRSLVMVEVQGRRMCLAEACEMFGANTSRTRHRLATGWDLMDALTRPQIRPAPARKKPLSPPSQPLVD